jgi:hypothetical protein
MMPMLDVALAFAITMLVTSTLVSYLVDVAHHLTKSRGKGFREMLERWTDEELMPTVQHHMAMARHRGELFVEKSVEDMTEGLHKAIDDAGGGGFISEQELQEMVSLPTEELRLRLRRSPFGAVMLEELGDARDQLLDELAERWDAVGRKASESFQTKSRLWSVVAAILLALFANIDSVHLVDRYMTNESVRGEVLAHLERVETSLEPGSDPDIGEIKAQVAALQAVGLPIGLAHFPHSCVNAEEPTACLDEPASVWASWFIGIALTVLFAGFGEPFWYDMVASITAVRKQARGG